MDTAHTKTYSLCLVGFGNVGRRLVEVLAGQAELLAQRYSIQFSISEIVEFGGTWVSPGWSMDEIVAQMHNKSQLQTWPGFRPGFEAERAIGLSPAQIMIELTPSNYKDGQPGFSHMQAAFRRGMHVVTANKGPLVTHFAVLKREAKRARRQFKFGGATAAALPTTNIGYYDLAGSTIEAIEGVLNGTTNYILTRINEDGISFEEALTEARDQGIAETNPTQDINGYDTAVKCLILARELMGADISLEDAEITGIENVDHLPGFGQESRVCRLIGRVERIEGKVKIRVEPMFIRADHPLYAVTGTAKGIVFHTDLFGQLLVTGGNSSLSGAAASILRDLINLSREEGKGV